MRVGVLLLLLVGGKETPGAATARQGARFCVDPCDDCLMRFKVTVYLFIHLLFLDHGKRTTG